MQSGSDRSRSSRGEAAEGLAALALDWLIGSARRTTSGWTWPVSTSDDSADPTLYRGAAGNILALLEAQRHFGDDRYADAAIRAAQALEAEVDRQQDCSLFFGLTGTAAALHAVATHLGQTSSSVRRALALVRKRFDGQRWNEMFELLAGNAGIGLGALYAGDVELALLAVTPYVQAADPTPAGVNWAVRPSPARSHHIAHGTLGIVYALATIGAVTGRRDLIELGRAGAADVVSRNEAGPDGFLVAHSDPPHRPDLIERYSYGWCNGPTGDAQVFRLLAEAAGDAGDTKWTALAQRCWHTVTHSGLPQRIRPGFWDNNGRCCGTAGVLALACDLMAEQTDAADFADTLVDDLTQRATIDSDGARWSNYEHRATPSTLPPQTGWAMGNAGIIRELLRYARVCAARPSGYAVAWPGIAEKQADADA